MSSNSSGDGENSALRRVEKEIVTQLCPEKDLSNVEGLFADIEGHYEAEMAKRNVVEAARVIATSYRCTNQNCRNTDQGLFLDDYRQGQGELVVETFLYTEMVLGFLDLTDLDSPFSVLSEMWNGNCG